MKKQIFEYGGVHFIPERKLTAEENDFLKISRRQCIDRDLGFCRPGYAYESKYPYSHGAFYEASTDKECDLFRCVENGKLYIPCENDLQEYIENKRRKNECLDCDCYDGDYGCTMPSIDRSYACPKSDKDDEAYRNQTTSDVSVGDVVEILDGSKVPQYYGGWYPSMNSLIGNIGIVESVTRRDEHSMAVSLKNHSSVFDSRGLLKIGNGAFKLLTFYENAFKDKKDWMSLCKELGVPPDTTKLELHCLSHTGKSTLL